MLSSWQGDAELVNDKDDSGTVNRINVEVFLCTFSFSHTSTAQAGNIWKGVRCAALTLQLVVEDTLKESSLRDVIKSARCICIKTRNPSVCVLLKKLKLIKPILGSTIKWHSTYDMLHRLLLRKDFCLTMAASNSNLHLPATT